MSYVDDVIQDVVQNHPTEPEFTSSVSNLLAAVRKPVRLNSRYEQMSILERMVEPESAITFSVPWIDDQGAVKVNRGYRVRFNSALGTCKGGIQFGPEIDMSKIKSYAFEQTFKNALTGLPVGGSNGGSDFDPEGKSQNEIMNFCKAYIIQLSRYMGSDVDIPDTGQGVSETEIGYMYGQFKRLTNAGVGSMAGKSLESGGIALRNEAGGYGLVYFLEDWLADIGDTLADKVVAISGCGHTANAAAEMAEQKGAKVITLSDEKGYLYDPNGIDVEFSKKVRAEHIYALSDYPDSHAGAEYREGATPWENKYDVAIPCLDRGEITVDDVASIVNSGAAVVAEGYDMACCNDATHQLQEAKTPVLPSKATTAGMVAVRVFELTQNSNHFTMSGNMVNGLLAGTMDNVYKSCSEAAKTYGYDGNFMIGAVIAAFERIAGAMLAEGV